MGKYQTTGRLEYVERAAEIYEELRDKEKLVEIAGIYLREHWYDPAIRLYRKAGRKKIAKAITEILKISRS